MEHLYFVLFLCLLGTGSVYSECNVCGRAQIACINQTSFQRCQGSTIIANTTVVCPQGSFCRSDSYIRCIQTEPSCGGRCNVCNPATYVTCVSRSQYAYCFGSTPDNQIQSCGAGEICNSDVPSICVNPLITISQPTCPDHEIPINPTPTATPKPIPSIPPTPTPTPTAPPSPPPSNTTSPPANEAQQFCLSVRYPGLYPNIRDINCRSYYHCYLLGNNINGQKYYCPGIQSYNCELRSCSYFCKTDCSLSSNNQYNSFTAKLL